MAPCTGTSEGSIELTLDVRTVIRERRDGEQEQPNSAGCHDKRKAPHISLLSMLRIPTMTRPVGGMALTNLTSCCH